MLDSKGVKILDKEGDWRRRGIKEAIWERVEDPSLCLTLGTGPSSPSLDVCHVIVNYHVTNFTDED